LICCGIYVIPSRRDKKLKKVKNPNVVVTFADLSKLILLFDSRGGFTLKEDFVKLEFNDDTVDSLEKNSFAPSVFG